MDSLCCRAVHEAAATSSNSISRVLLIGYGQSNMGTFFKSYSDSSPAPNANVSYFNGSIIVKQISAGALGDGIVGCMNQINNDTGLPVLCLTGAVGGTGIGGLVPGERAFTSLLAQINAVIRPTDYVVTLWDQGEGDANTAPPEQPQYYIDNLKLIRDGIASRLGRPTAPLLVAGLGTIWGVAGQPSGGNSQANWQKIKSAHFFSSVQIPHVYYSHTNVDITRASATDYHYIAPSIQGMGQRFAQAVTSLMGIGPSGFAHWEIGSAATVDTTHTNVNLIHSLGTDFTPTSSADGWQVSGDNGANWVTATGARNSATQLQLTHSSVSTSNARLVRYQWGFNQAGSSAGPTSGYLRDNSALVVPLTPSTWDIRPSGASSTVPCTTWRNITTINISSTSLSTESLYCFPSTDNYQKFLIIPVFTGYPPDMVGNPMTLRVTPLDVNGNAAGSQVTATYVGEHPTKGMAFFQATLGSDANSATNLMLTASFLTNPNTFFSFQIFDVPLASLSSTTNTGTNSSSTTLAANTTPPLTSNCTVNVSAGGLMVAINWINNVQSTPGAFATYSSNFNNRWEDGSTITLDAANSSANASSPFSVSFGTTDPSNPINMYTLMASWR